MSEGRGGLDGLPALLRAKFDQHSILEICSVQSQRLRRLIRLIATGEPYVSIERYEADIGGPELPDRFRLVAVNTGLDRLNRLIGIFAVVGGTGRRLFFRGLARFGRGT